MAFINWANNEGWKQIPILCVCRWFANFYWWDFELIVPQVLLAVKANMRSQYKLPCWANTQLLQNFTPIYADMIGNPKNVICFIQLLMSENRWTTCWSTRGHLIPSVTFNLFPVSNYHCWQKNLAAYRAGISPQSPDKSCSGCRSTQL